MSVLRMLATAVLIATSAAPSVPRRRQALELTPKRLDPAVCSLGIDLLLLGAEREEAVASRPDELAAAALGRPELVGRPIRWLSLLGCAPSFLRAFCPALRGI